LSDTPPTDGPPQRLSRQQLPKRFYKTAAVGPQGDGFALFLDDRAVKTPGRRPLAVASAAVAEALAAEWGGQGDHIDPSTMPITRIVNAAIDHVADAMPAVRAEIVRYAGSDLVCYRAETPDALAAMQAAVWDPLVRWAREALGAHLRLAAGVVHVAQPPEALAAIARAVEPFDPLALAAVSTATTLTGSAIIALAIAYGHLKAEDAWAASLVDEEWEMQHWGRDTAALAARAFRWREMGAAGVILGART
jgi:chaperone required for assembly of F1-ATPase